MSLHQALWFSPRFHDSGCSSKILWILAKNDRLFLKCLSSPKRIVKTGPIYLSPLLLLGHRASTTVRQRQISVLDHPFSLAPWVVDLCDVNLEVMKPGVPWSPSLSLALGIPAEGLYSDICWLTKGVPYPFPSLPFDFIFCWLLVGLPLEFCCADDVWPADP